MAEARSAPGSSNFLPPDMSAIGTKGFEAFAAVQKEFMDAVGKVNRTWASYLNDEAALATNLTQKITKAASIPEAAAAYQEWANQHMELVSKQAKKVFEDTQEFTKACSQIAGNGKGPAST
jgi:hypothetical protein